MGEGMFSGVAAPSKNGELRAMAFGGEATGM